MSPPSAVPSTASAPAPVEDARWFAAEVHPHDGPLKAWLRGQFPSVRDVDDVVQESYLRIWKARAAQPIQSAKAFLFRVARNVALDLVRRSHRSPVSTVADLTTLPILEDQPGVVDQVSAAEKLALLAEAIAALPPRGRELILLCRIKGVSHRAAAAQLGITERTVDEHVYRALRRLGEELRRRGMIDIFGP